MQRLLSLLLISTASSSKLLCEDVQLACISRLPCSMALHGHRLDCKHELSGRTPGQCSVPCRQSLISLASTEEGFDLLKCDCGTDAFCKALDHRVSTCWWQRPPCSRDNLSPRPSCSRLVSYCVGDAVCASAWDYYRRFCHEVLDGGSDKCHARCKNSVSVLLRMEQTHRLLDCVCDSAVSRNVCARELNKVRTLCFELEEIDPSGAFLLEGLGMKWLIAFVVSVVWLRR
ncbi:uncharacterized protein LOC135398698 [Ornithodoros turicata]|uniref:uncharacterized protein LOC135398698 n=1 Tax=Ornithodoros turicata TaxID=34597 RepID=UPI003138880A